MSTIRDVAKLAGVSVGTVSRYLNGAVLKSSNQRKIQSAINKLGYQQNYIAKGLKNNKSMAIGVLINSLDDVFATSIVSELELFVEQFGYSIIICDYRQNSKRLNEKIDFLLQRSIDGLITFHVESSSPSLRKVNSLGIPIVAIDAPINDIKADAVLVDNYEASKGAVNRLIKTGYKHIGIIAGQNDNYVGRERLEGYKSALVEAGIGVKASLIWEGDYTINSGFNGTNKLLEANLQIDALFAINYYMALGTIKALNKRKLIIGQEFGLITFDRFSFNEIITPAITAIIQPIKKMGHEAGKLIIERMMSYPKTFKSKRIICKTTVFNGDSDKKALA